MDYTTRTATKADVTAVMALWRTAESRPSVTDTEQALNGLLKRDSGSLLLAADGVEIVGTLIVGWDGWRGNFYRLAVHPEWRRKGLAVALVGAGEKKLAEMGAVRLTALLPTTSAQRWRFGNPLDMSARLTRAGLFAY